MNQVIIIGGAPNATYAVTASDTAAVLADPDKIYQDGTANGKVAIGAMITVEDNPIRWGVGGLTPTAGGNGHVANPNDVIKLSSWKAVKTFKYINEVAGSNAVLQITILF
jgi:hypothetical protein